MRDCRIRVDSGLSCDCQILVTSGAKARFSDFSHEKSFLQKLDKAATIPASRGDMFGTSTRKMLELDFHKFSPEAITRHLNNLVMLLKPSPDSQRMEPPAPSCS